MVAVCERRGMGTQEAIDTVGRLLNDRYSRWDEIEATVPSWGEPVDTEVKRYIEAIKTIVHGNLSWSFKSERYLGHDPAKVRRTRRMEIYV
ncbi:Presilphiperfolan-8-beta-ol synthase [Tolypocladium ophioglossoides CBS 100239]|uniref:Presilphiperfolan-8-beta-ol synthase n=1 Tax=Tolypocladium ophioglossoides (strain CBS 100239) TaxID=1163406 RepID=A0A0L0MXB3_TOLOC|nr:Presilphiperfolan-8-beta-ol synthase [Tolypocladium ophioglossoides CBS 100239]